MNTFFTQLETQVDANGTKAVIPMAYDDLDAALAKHYAVLSVAAVSAVPYHASFILRSDGILIEGRVFDRRVASEPEPEEVVPEEEVEA